MSTTNSALIDYYKRLLILQYQDRPKACATVAAVVGSTMIYELMDAVRYGYSIDTAAGTQLDILGKYIGVSRVIQGIDFSRSYFGYQEYSTTTPTFLGYIEYGEMPSGKFASYEDSQQSRLSLSDPEYRMILKMKLAKNVSENSTQAVDDVMLQLFGTDVVFTDNGDMTISYEFVMGLEFIVSIAEALDVLPRPMGVQMTITFA